MRSHVYLFSLAIALGLAAPSAAVADEAAASWLYVLTGEVLGTSATEIAIDADPTVIAFSDRPARQVRTTSVEAFIDDIWQAGKDSFASDPPNAALVVGDGQVAIDELLSVARDGRTVSFTTSALDGGPPQAGSRIALVIDYGGAGGLVPDKMLIAP